MCVTVGKGEQMSLCIRCANNVNDDCTRDRMVYPNTSVCNAFTAKNNAVVPIYTPPQTKWEVFNNAEIPKCIFIADLSGE